MGLQETLLQLLNNVGPVTRRTALREIASYLMRANRQRIRANVQPAGGAMIKRQHGAGRMFRKIGKRLQSKVSSDGAAVGFYGRTGWVASNHQLGRAIRKGSNTLNFPVRELLGIAGADRAAVHDILLRHIRQGLAA